MHELILSENIVRTALSAGSGRGRITAIAVQVGALSGASVSALEFCLQVALQERGMEGAELRIRNVPAELECECGNRYVAEQMFSPCPECGGFMRQIIAGKDVTVEYIEVDDDESQPGSVGPEEQ